MVEATVAGGHRRLVRRPDPGAAAGGWTARRAACDAARIRSRVTSAPSNMSVRHDGLPRSMESVMVASPPVR